MKAIKRFEISFYVSIKSAISLTSHYIYEYVRKTEVGLSSSENFSSLSNETSGEVVVHIKLMFLTCPHPGV